MKIIQSFWSYPALRREPVLGGTCINGGWLNEKYHLMSWALSCLQLRKYYNEVELFTDKVGKEILIDKLGLPYTNVHLIFDDLQNFNSQLWALGKIFTYSKQKKPFLHVDGDVYVWKRFSNRIENASIIAQNVEIGFSFYGPLLNSLFEQNFYIPESILRTRDHELSPRAYNAGILGGNDLKFIQSFAMEALKFVASNHDHLASIDVGLFNTIFEQHLFYCMAREANKKVSCQLLIKDKHKLNAHLKNLDQFEKAPVGKKYIHLFGEDAKKNIQICKALSEKLKAGHPKFFDRVIQFSKCQ